MIREIHSSWGSLLKGDLKKGMILVARCKKKGGRRVPDSMILPWERIGRRAVQQILCHWGQRKRRNMSGFPFPPKQKGDWRGRSRNERNQEKMGTSNLLLDERREIVDISS